MRKLFVIIFPVCILFFSCNQNQHQASGVSSEPGLGSNTDSAKTAAAGTDSEKVSAKATGPGFDSSGEAGRKLASQNLNADSGIKKKQSRTDTTLIEAKAAQNRNLETPGSVLKQMKHNRSNTK